MRPETQNLITLRDVVFPDALKMDDVGMINLNYYKYSSAVVCGTAYCLKGLYCHLTNQDDNVSSWCANDSARVTNDMTNHFGINEEEHKFLFGASNFGTLQDRYDHLCKLIDKRLEAEKPALTGVDRCMKFLQEPVLAEV